MAWDSYCVYVSSVDAAHSNLDGVMVSVVRSSVLLSVLLLGCFESHRPVAGGGLADADVERAPWCEREYTNPFPAEPPCGEEASEMVWPAEMICRGENELVLFDPRQFAHAATCTVSRDAARGVVIETAVQWCADHERFRTDSSYVRCDELPSGTGAALLLDETPIDLAEHSCTRAHPDYGGCTGNDERAFYPGFVASGVCVQNVGDCSAATLRIVGPQPASAPPGERTSVLRCISTRYERGRLHVEAGAFTRDCFTALPREVNDPLRIGECPLPPNLPRGPIEVFVNGSFVRMLDLATEPECEALDR